MKTIRTNIFFIVLSFSFLLKAQTLISTPENKGMKAHFSASSLQVYQESSWSKVQDFYQYLELLSGETISESLEKQVKENLYSLVKDRNIQMIDFTSESASRIILTEFISKLEKEKFVKFTVKQNANSSQDVSPTYWVNSYIVKINRNNKTQSFLIKQKVYFFPQIKEFGSEKKEVWNILLGEME